MPAVRRVSVVILYRHPLLGEGLLDMLADEPGFDPVAIDVDDLRAVEQALEHKPQVIIFERGDPDRAVEILEIVPDALVIDVGLGAGPTFTYRRDVISPRPDSIVDAIRQASLRESISPAGTTARTRVVGPA